jgi:hypothetical protein
VAGSCEHGNEPSGSVTGGNFLNIRVAVSFSKVNESVNMLLITLYTHTP